MASPNDIADLLENIRTELPERLHDLYEEAVHRATEKAGKRGQHVARRMMKRNPWLRAERRRQQQEEGALAIFTLIIGLIGGAALMYLFDPHRGKRRRALLRDQVNKAVNTTTDRVDGMPNDARNRAMGAAHEAKQRFEDEAVSDSVLIARVWAEMGHTIAHPGAIEVTANAGTVTLSGNILTKEMPLLLAKVRLIPGVRAVENHLLSHESPENIPDLQNGTPSQTGSD